MLQKMGTALWYILHCKVQINSKLFTFNSVFLEIKHRGAGQRSSSFCHAFLALESPGSSGTQRTFPFQMLLWQTVDELRTCSKSPLLACNSFGGVAAASLLLLALTCIVLRACAFHSLFTFCETWSWKEALTKQGKKRDLELLCRCLSASWEAPGGAEQLSDKICFPGTCRNTLVFLWVIAWNWRIQRFTQLPSTVLIYGTSLSLGSHWPVARPLLRASTWAVRSWSRHQL